METASVCVHGASGYTGAECIRWVLNHPRLRLVGATAQKAAGKPLASLWPRLGRSTTLTVGSEPVPADVHLLCLPHGQAAQLAPQLAGLVVDLSGDHRLAEPDHSAAYGFTRETPPWLYGLPELGTARYAGQTRVANPGCFATALALALLPAARQLPAVVTAMGLTGSTGSGATPSEGTHHPTRDENLRPYKVLTHQHVPEVLRAVREAGGTTELQFVPISAPLRRGILVSVPLPGAEVEAYRRYYADSPLIVVSDRPPDLNAVVGTALAHVAVVRHQGAAVVFCVIDNLGRGAATQAIANVNLLLGSAVDEGLAAIGPVV